MAQHNIQGKNGEELAASFLLSKGYSILERNWRYSKNEVDMIAKKNNLLIFVEVKTRKSEFFGLPESFVSATQKRNLARLSEQYCISKQIKDAEIRYDIIAVIKNKAFEKILHFEDAFFPDLT